MCETSLAGPTSGKIRIVADTGAGKVPPLVAAGAEHRSSGSTARTCWTWPGRTWIWMNVAGQKKQ